MMQRMVADRLLGDAILDGIGLTARMLIVQPESTLGTRVFRETPAECAPMLRDYGDRITLLLTRTDEVLDYSVDVYALLFDVQDTISAATLAVSRSGTGELVASGLDVEGGVITAWLGPGLSGRNYTIRIQAATAGGRWFEWTVCLRIDPTQATYPLFLSNAGYGTPLTWGGNASVLDFSDPVNSGLVVLL